MILPNLPLSAEKPLSHTLRWKYSQRKSTGEAIILVRISARHDPSDVLLWNQNSETDLSNILITFRVLKYLSRRIDFMATPTRLSIETALEKASHSDSRDTPQPTYMPVARSISEKK